MKLQAGYIGNIILQSSEFGTVASYLGVRRWGWVGGWDYPVAGDEVEPFLTILPTADPPFLICYSIATLFILLYFST